MSMREKEEVTRIIYIRHGSTDFPENRIYCDEIENPPLNSKGMAQVEPLGRFLKNEAVDVIYTSPSKRTLMTAEPVIRACGMENIISEKLKERHFGNLEGLYFSEIERDHPEDYAKWKSDPAAFRPDGGESVYDMLKRVTRMVSEIISRHLGKTIVVVSHVGPIRMVISDAFRMPTELYRQLSIDNASLTRIDYGTKQNNFIFMNNKCF